MHSLDYIKGVNNMNTEYTDRGLISNNDVDNNEFDFCSDQSDLNSKRRLIRNRSVLDFIRYNLPDMIRERLEDLPIISLHTEEVVKNNGTVLMGIYIRLEGSNVSPCIYVEPYLPPDVDRQPVCWDRIADAMAGDFRSAVIVSYKENHELAEKLFDPEDIPERLELTLVNRELNKDLLKTLPHRDFLDLSVIMRWEVICGGRRSIVKISNDVVDHWGIDPDTLFHEALINTMKKFPGRVETLDNVVEEITGIKINGTEAEAGMIGMGLAGSVCAPLHSPFYYFGTENLCNGSISVIYPGMLRKMYEALGEAYYLIPSSINEFLALPMSFEPFPERIKDIIISVNEDVLPRMEVLSDSLYIYRPEQDRLEIYDNSN